MATQTTTKPPDLAALRGLSAETLTTFQVQPNHNGWQYPTKCMDGTTAMRWKSYSSTRPAGDESWQKYRWIPGKPESAKYFYPPSHSLKEAVEAANGQLYLVGGEIGVMTLFEAGIRAVTCTFGDGAVPDTLLADLRNWSVTLLHLLPDRDHSGQQWAVKIRDLLRGAMDVDTIVYTLPYTLEPKHGKDVNDFWLDHLSTEVASISADGLVRDTVQRKPTEEDKAAFLAALEALPVWTLPLSEKSERPKEGAFEADSTLPQRFIADLKTRLGFEEVYGDDGWTRKNFSCSNPTHTDNEASAGWNNAMQIEHCFVCGTFLAKQVGEHYGLRLADYYETAPKIETWVGSPGGELATAKLPNPKAPVVNVTEPVAPPSPVQTSLAYPLPPGIALTDDQREQVAGGRVWLDQYIQWASQVSPLSPDFFHEALGLWLLSAVATRRVKVNVKGQNIFPNLYLFIVARTTVYRKTSAIKAVQEVLRRANLSFLLLPGRATPEALFENLAGHLPANYSDLSEAEQQYCAMGRTFAAQRALLEDEASGLLSEMQKDYMAGLTELLLSGYDSEGEHRKQLKSQGMLTLRDMSLSFLAATTPIEWGRRMRNEERQNGFVARFAVITPPGAPRWREAPDEALSPDVLVAQLRRMFLHGLPWDGRCRRPDGTPIGLPLADKPETPPVTSATIAPQALASMNAYRKALGFDIPALDGALNEDKLASYARLGTMVFKVAMLLAAIDAAGTSIRIEPEHAYAAQDICERWRESLHRLDDHVAASRWNSEGEDKVLKFIRAHGELGVTERDIRRGCSMNDVRGTLNTLQDAGLIELFQRQRTGAGRPAMCYKAVSS